MMTPYTDTAEYLLGALRTLYGSRGYSHYKMNKFEEYDLYASNKDFLISDSIITFTDGNGKLLALKPDVTLSIVKNTTAGPGGTKKLWYNENVYRVAKGGSNFREIMQVGLECIGDVDDYCLSEVLSLAKESLGAVGGRNVLAVSHLGLLTEVMEYLGVPAGERAELLRMIGERNLHEIRSFLRENGVVGADAELIPSLLSLKGSTPAVLSSAEELLSGKAATETLGTFRSVLAPFAGDDAVQIDFSVVSDLHYYNGFVFKGYTEGIPTSILSGGQYDRLMKKMGKNSGAVGFAVYLDLICQYSRTETGTDVDVLLLYDPSSSPDVVGRAVSSLIAGGERVLAARKEPTDVTWKKKVILVNGEAANDENDA